MKYTLKNAIATYALAVLAMPSTLLAAGGNEVPERTFTPHEKKTFLSGNTDCFEHYKYGSVTPVFGALSQKVKAGDVAMFEGRLENKNSFPLAGVTLYVKIARVEGDTEVAHKDGDNIVDEYTAVEGVSVPAALGGKPGEQKIAFSWNVPQSAMSGDYRVLSYVAVENKFNMNGLSFMDDVNAGGASFIVEGTGAEPFFKKDGVTLSGAPYYFAGWSPSFKKNESVVISAPAFNPLSSPAAVHVTWRAYNWDALLPQNLIETKEEDYTLPAGHIENLVYKAPTAKGTATYVVAEMSSGGVKSILNIRFSRPGFPEAHFNFVGLEKFPQTGKVPVTVCFQSTMEEIPDATLSMSATDENGMFLDGVSLPVTLMSNIAAYTTMLDLKSHTHVKLTASLKQDSQLLEQISLNYDCKNLDSCKQASGLKPIHEGDDGANDMVVVSITLLLLGIVGVVIYARMKKQLPPTFPVAILFIAFMITFAPHVTHAETSSVGYSGNVFFDQGASDPDAIDACNHGILPRNLDGRLRRRASCGKIVTKSVNVSFNGNITYHANASISSGSALPVGTTINFSDPHGDSDISWFASGSVSDSPFGYWSYPSSGQICQGSNEFPTTSGLNRYGYSVPSYPGMTMVGDQNASCAGNSCTVTGPGPVHVHAAFPATSGTFGVYFRVSCSPAADEGYSVPATNIGFNYTGTSVSPPTLTVTPNSTTLNYNDPLPAGTFSWSSSNAATCSVSNFGGWSGAISLSGSNTALGPQVGSWTATFTCANGAGTVSRNVTVNVRPPALPTVTAYSSGGTNLVGPMRSDFSWNSSNTSGCSVSSTAGYWNASAGQNGSISVGPISSNVTFSVTCRNSSGNTASDNVTYRYVPPAPPVPSLSVWASPAVVTSGGGTSVFWSASNVTGNTCVLTGDTMGWIAGGLPASGSYWVSGIWSSTRFAVMCTNASGSGSGSVNVAVVTSPSVWVSASPVTVSSGGSATITWSSSGATSCAVSPTGWSGTSGSRTVSGLMTTTSYSVTCNGPGGTNTSWATVTVVSAPLVSITASPMTIAPGSSSWLTWSSSGATSCSVSPSGFTGTSGSRATVAMWSTSTYTLNCSGPGGSSSQSVTISVVAPPVTPTPIVTVSPSSRTVTSGGTTSFTWSAVNATTCNRYRDGGWDQGGVGTSGSFTSPALAFSVTYEIRCANISGMGPYPEGSGWQTVTVTPPPARPVVSISASPTNIFTGGVSAITWSSSNAFSCIVNPGSWSGTSGSRSTGSLSSSQTYTISCSGPGGTTVGSVTVNVSAAMRPSVSISAAPILVPRGSQSTITWSSMNATTCTVTPTGWSGTSNSVLSPALSSDTTFTVTCSGPGGSNTANVTVNTIVPPPTPSVTITPTTASVVNGDKTSFSWTTMNATVCNRYRFGVLEQLNVGMSGTFTSPALTSNTTYEIRCANVSGPGPYPEGSGWHTVTIAPAPPVFSMTIPHDFNDVAVGDTSTYPVTVSNIGGNGLTCSLSLADASGTFSLGGGTNINNLSAGGSRSINLSFTPLVVGVDVNASLTVSCSNPVYSHIYALHGRGTVAVDAPLTINIGDVPAGTARYFNALAIKNNKSTPVDVCVIVPRVLPVDSMFTVESTASAVKHIASGATSKFKIGFAPVAPAHIPTGYRVPMSVRLNVGTKVGSACVPIPLSPSTVTITANSVEPKFSPSER